MKTITEKMCDQAEQATGCSGAGDYRRWAAKKGFPHLYVVDWTSSAGDWCFIVSKDKLSWYMMYQENNYPRSGFTRTIDNYPRFVWGKPATEELVLEAVSGFEGF